MAASEAPDTDRECRVFVRYLADRDPGADTDFLRAYARGLESAAYRAACGNPGRFDRYLARMAATGPNRAWACDAYARWFLPDSILRKKLVLVLALLETRAAYAERVDLAHGGGLRGLLVPAAVQFGKAAVLFVAALLVLVPARLILGNEAD